MTESELLARAYKMLSRVCGLTVNEPIRMTIAELQTVKGKWPAWRNEPGIYFFVHGGAVVYVGKAMPSQKLGNRIGDHLGKTSDPRWGPVVRDPATVVGVMSFPSDDWEWLATLEAWLLDPAIRPTLNSRY